MQKRNQNDMSKSEIILQSTIHSFRHFLTLYKNKQKTQVENV